VAIGAGETMETGVGTVGAVGGSATTTGGSADAGAIAIATPDIGRSGAVYAVGTIVLSDFLIEAARALGSFCPQALTGGKKSESFFAIGTS
jgi:hypothetical protein